MIIDSKEQIERVIKEAWDKGDLSAQALALQAEMMRIQNLLLARTQGFQIDDQEINNSLGISNDTSLRSNFR